MVTIDTCRICLERIPYCTLVGTLVTGVGIVILIAVKNSLISVSKQITKKFIGPESSSLSKADKYLIYLSLAFLCLTALVVVIGFFSNGDLRARFFRYSFMRCVGMIINIVLLLLTLALMCGWLHRFVFYSQYYFYVLNSEVECALYPTRGFTTRSCVGQDIANFLLDEKDIIQYDICRQYREVYCEEYVPKFKNKFFPIFVAFCIIIMGHVIYCMCLAANFVKIQSQGKFQELEDLRSLEFDMTT